MASLRQFFRTCYESPRLAALASFVMLAGCGIAPDYANSGARVRAKEWTSYAWEERTPPQHCYRTLALAECFQQPVTGQDYRIIPSGVAARTETGADSAPDSAPPAAN